MSAALTLEQRFLLAEAAAIELLRRTQAHQVSVSAQYPPDPRLSDLQTQIQHLQSENQALQARNLELGIPDTERKSRTEELMARDEEQRREADKLLREKQILRQHGEEMQARVRQLEDEVTMLKQMLESAVQTKGNGGAHVNGIVNEDRSGGRGLANGVLEKDSESREVGSHLTNGVPLPSNTHGPGGAVNGISKPTTPTTSRLTHKSFVNGTTEQPSINGASSSKPLTNGITYPTATKPNLPVHPILPRNPLPKILRQSPNLLDLGDTPDPTFQPSPSILAVSIPAPPHKPSTLFEQAVRASPVYGLYPTKDALKRSLHLHTESWHPVHSGRSKYPIYFDEGIFYTPPPDSGDERRAVVLTGLDAYCSIEDVLQKIHTGPILSVSATATFLYIVFVHADAAKAFAEIGKKGMQIRECEVQAFLIPTPTTPIPAYLYNGIHFHGFSRVLGIRWAQGRRQARDRVTVEAVRRMGWRYGPEVLIRIWKDRQEDMIIAIYTGVAAAVVAREDMLRAVEFQERRIEFLRDPCDGRLVVEGMEVELEVSKQVSVGAKRDGGAEEEEGDIDVVRDSEPASDSEACGNDATLEVEDLMVFTEATPISTEVSGPESPESDNVTSTPTAGTKGEAGVYAQYEA